MKDMNSQSKPENSFVKVTTTSNNNFNFIEQLREYNDLLIPHGYTKDAILDLVINEEISNEEDQLLKKSSLYLLSIKKILLYATPIVAPFTSKFGLSLTSAFPLDAIEYNQSKNKIEYIRLGTNDKFKLLGFHFANELISNLSVNVYNYKYYSKLLINCFDTLSLEHFSEIDTDFKKSSFYLIKPKFYENTQFYNKVLEMIFYTIKLYKTHATVILNNYYRSNGYLDLELNISKYKKFKSFKYQIPEYNKDKNIPKINELLSKKINTNYEGSYFNIMYDTYNGYLYELIFLYGFDSSKVKTKLDTLSYIKKQKKIADDNQYQLLKNKLLESRAEKITKELYPFLFSHTDARGIFKRFNKFSLSKLVKKYKDNVLIQLEKSLEYQESLINNKCDHLQLVKNLKIADDNNKVELYKLLVPYINKERLVNHQYKCKNCDFNILCKHEVDLYELLITSDSNETFYKIYQKIVNEYKLIQKDNNSIDFIENAFTYYCKYCSKELGKTDDIVQVSSKDTNSANSYDEAAMKFKSEISHVIEELLRKNVNSLELKLTKKMILHMIIDLTYSELNDLNINLEKNKTLLNKAEILRFHTMIYILVSFIYLNVHIAKNSKPILVGGNQQSAQLGEQNASGILKTEFKKAYEILKTNVLYKTSGISDIKLKSLLIEYYRNINKHSINEEVSETPSAYNITYEIIQNPIYSYIKYILALFNKNYNPSFDQIIGKPASLIIEQANSTKKGTDALKNIYDSIPDIKLPNTASKRLIYIYNSYKTFRDYVILGNYKVTNNETLDINLQKFMTEEDNEIKLIINNPYYFLEVFNSRECDFKLTNLNSIYCESGEKHKWNYVFKNDNEIIFNQKQIKELINNQLYNDRKLKFIDFECDLCNVRYSKVSEKINEVIETNIEDQNNKIAFFELYMLTCPIKNNHIYKDNKCEQCLVTRNELINMDTKYYKKFQSNYLKYRKDKINNLLESSKRISSINKINKSTSPKFEIPVNPEELESEINRMVLLISKQFNISYDKLYLIGLSEGHSYDKLLQDFKINKSVSNTSMRISNLISYARLVSDYYYYVKNVSTISNHYDKNFNFLIKTKFYKNNKLVDINVDDLQFNVNNIESLLNVKISQDTKSEALRIDNSCNLILYIIFKHLISMISNKETLLIHVAEYIIDKILYQDLIKSNYDYGTLKATNVNIETLDYDNIQYQEAEDDEEENDFSTYGLDIDSDLMDGDEDYDLDINLD
jgi:hypothetical protein